MKENPSKIIWSCLSSIDNNETLDYLIKNSEKINWTYFSSNSNDKAIDYLMKNVNKIELSALCKNRNPRALEIIKILNTNNLYWSILSNNQIIFKLDYEKIKINFEPIAEEIIKEVMNPKRINYYLNNLNYDYLEEMFGY